MYRTASKYHLYTFTPEVHHSLPILSPRAARRQCCMLADLLFIYLAWGAVYFECTSPYYINFLCTRAMPKVMSTFIVLQNKGTYVRKLILSIVTVHTTLLFCKISRTIHAFLPVLHELKNPAVVEIRSNSLQPATHVCLDDVIVFIVLASQELLQGPEQMVVCTVRVNIKLTSWGYLWR